MQQIVRIRIESFILNSTYIKGHPDDTKCQKIGPWAIGKSRGGWNTKIHMVAAHAPTLVCFVLTPGSQHDAPVGRERLQELGPIPEGLLTLIDHACEGDETRQLVLDFGMIPVVPPKSDRISPWDYDGVLCKKRDEIESLFRWLKGFRRFVSRFEKQGVVFEAFLSFAIILEARQLSVNMP